MTDPLPIILTIVVALPFLLALLAMFLLPLFKHREKGPWVVCRVAADGSGGMEFFLLGESRKNDSPLFWGKRMGHKHDSKRIAQQVADEMLADIMPLSKFTGSNHV